MITTAHLHQNDIEREIEIDHALELKDAAATNPEEVPHFTCLECGWDLLPHHAQSNGGVPAHFEHVVGGPPCTLREEQKKGNTKKAKTGSNPGSEMTALLATLHDIEQATVEMADIGSAAVEHISAPLTQARNDLLMRASEANDTATEAAFSEELDILHNQWSELQPQIMPWVNLVEQSQTLCEELLNLSSNVAGEEPPTFGQLARDLRGVERAVLSSARLCEVTGIWGYNQQPEFAKCARITAATLVGNRDSLTLSIKCFEQPTNNQAYINPDDFELLKKKLAEAQFENSELKAQLKHLNIKPLDKLDIYTPEFFAARYQSSVITIRGYFREWSDKMGFEQITRPGRIGRWGIQEREIAFRFDFWLSQTMRKKPS